MSDYLWDRSGEIDAEVAALEQTLVRYRLRNVEPPSERSAYVYRPLAARPARRWATAAAVFAVVVLASLMWLRNRVPKDAYEVLEASGSVAVDGRADARGELALGKWLETGADGRVRMRVADIGWIELEPNSKLMAIESRPGRRRLRLEAGAIRAQISAAPGVFLVETPIARAIDLGCAYTLRLQSPHEGEVHVSAGWVAMDRGFRQSLVPAGSLARFAEGGRISPPISQTSSPQFQAAVLAWWRSDEGAAARQQQLASLLRSAQKSDALTLLNLFRDASEQERPAVFDRLNVLVPAPPAVDREAILRGERNATGPWWPVIINELGLSQIKKKGPLGVGVFAP